MPEKRDCLNFVKSSSTETCCYGQNGAHILTFRIFFILKTSFYSPTEQGPYHRTQKPSAFPGAPSKPRVSDIADTSVHLTWTASEQIGQSHVFAFVVEYFSPQTSEVRLWYFQHLKFWIELAGSFSIFHFHNFSCTC